MALITHTNWKKKLETIQNRNVTHHSFVSMRQEHNQATLPVPLGLSVGDELIHDALCGVVEVTELCLPENQGAWVGNREPKLKT